METAQAKALTSATGWRSASATLHRHEVWISLYFLSLGLLGLVRPVRLGAELWLLSAPALLWVAARWEERSSRPWGRPAREWMSLAAILPAYWCLELFTSGHQEQWQREFLRMDRWILGELGLRQGIEAFGPVLPALLEICYLSLYAAPVVGLAALYLSGERRRAGRFLSVLFLGTLGVYASIPLFPVVSPRYAFPGTDLPDYSSPARQLNVWLLDHMDISTGVFPSGHVAVAFSCALGLWLAAPKKRALWGTAFAFGAIVFLATIYGRYHYAVDGMASILIAFAAFGVNSVWGRDAD
jgi:membrane-associated phospholipid phosphatase